MLSVFCYLLFVGLFGGFVWWIGGLWGFVLGLCFVALFCGFVGFFVCMTVLSIITGAGGPSCCGRDTAGGRQDDARAAGCVHLWCV